MGTLRAWGAAITVACVFAACGGPGEPTRNCRRYATRLNENGSAWTCAFEAAWLALRCSIGVSSQRSWAYASVTDFVHEAGIPKSNGELVVRDAHGNIVQEVEFGGSGGRLREFVVESTAEVCAP